MPASGDSERNENNYLKNREKKKRKERKKENY
jgi:hypothetical protein